MCLREVIGDDSVAIGDVRRFLTKPPTSPPDAKPYKSKNTQMKLTQKMNELINSGITLTAKETEEVEAFIESKSQLIKPSHLAHYQCLSAIRNHN